MLLAYLAGPYSGDVAENIYKAREAAVKLWDMGYAVLCPHLNTANFDVSCQRATYEDFMQGDLIMVSRCDLVIMLPGWESSPGARRERDFAVMKGMRVLELENALKEDVFNRAMEALTPMMAVNSV